MIYFLNLYLLFCNIDFLFTDIRSRNVTEPGKKKLRKEPFCIDYDQEVDFDNLFKVSRATMLTKSTMMKHSKKKNTLPKDLHYDADKLFRLFQKDKVMVSTGILY